MDILGGSYPDYEHFFIYDNTKTHTKRVENALLARYMPKNTPKPGTNWGVEITVKDDSGNIIYGSDGKPKKKKVRMGPGIFKDGTLQDFYFPPGHPRKGVFKGMAVILEERGYKNPRSLRAQCPKFKCLSDASECRCRCILFNEADFANVKSLLEIHCEKRGYQVVSSPNFTAGSTFLRWFGGKPRGYTDYYLLPPKRKT